MLVGVEEVEVEEEELAFFAWLNFQPRKVVESEETALTALIETLILYRIGSDVFVKDAKTEQAIGWLNACQVNSIQYMITLEHAEAIFGAEYMKMDVEHMYAYDEGIRAEALKFIEAN